MGHQVKRNCSSGSRWQPGSARPQAMCLRPIARVALALALITAVGACREAGLRRSEEVVVTERPSPNYTVFVIEDGTGIRRLRFERHGVDQSAVRLGDPDHLVFPYMRSLVAAFALRPEPQSILVIGLGGGSFPMFARHHLPEARIDVAELDPVVVEVAKRDMGFVEDAAIHVHVGDGRAFIESSERRWDVIVLDAYGMDNVPLALATRTFYEAVKRRLSPGGLVAANLWGDGANPRYRSMLRTFEAVFPEVHVIAPTGSESRVVLALPEPQGIASADLVARAKDLGTRWGLSFDLAAIIRRGHGLPGALPPGGAVIEDAP
ncbi:MAG: fused MFS/spermidine synthase [Deltaproteobacteria bacterium]|nr:fused MFS/spermidine synthase [Deltaproteobacteria bacterium]